MRLPLFEKLVGERGHGHLADVVVLRDVGRVAGVTPDAAKIGLAVGSARGGAGGRGREGARMPLGLGIVLSAGNCAERKSDRPTIANAASIEPASFVLTTLAIIPRTQGFSKLECCRMLAGHRPASIFRTAWKENFDEAV